MSNTQTHHCGSQRHNRGPVAAALAVGALALLCGACSSDKSSTADTTQAKDPAGDKTAGDKAAGADKSAAKPPKPDEAKKMPERAKQTIELAELGGGKPLAIDVAPGFEVKQSTADYARLEGGGVVLLIEIPAEGVARLDERALLGKPGVTTLADETFEGGEALAYQADGKIYAVVAWPALGILCSGANLASADDARRVIAMCKTLRAGT